MRDSPMSRYCFYPVIRYRTNHAVAYNLGSRFSTHFSLYGVHTMGDNLPGIAIDLLALFRKQQLQRQEDQLSTGGPVTQTRPSADPQNQSAASVNSLNTASRTVIGVITDATPIGHIYRVQLEKMRQPMAAIYAPRTTTTRFGATEFTSLQPGTQVLCVLHDMGSIAVIIGVLPPPNTNPAKGFFGLLHASTRARVDSADYAPYRMEDNGGATSFTAGRPYDSILGDYGAMSETGCRILIDSFMAQLGVTEMSQLTFYHHDMLAKLAAYNYLAWTCCSERESLNDQDEVSDWTGYATYPWEQLGQFVRQDPTRILTAQQWQKDTPAYSKMELADDYTMPFHREREWHGYLGQGGRRAVVGPPQTNRDRHFSYRGGGGTVNPVLPGLYDEFTLLDGRHGMQSVKGISIVKRAGIMLPVRRRRPEDPNGDNSQTYKASGTVGNGSEHKITGDIATTASHPSQNRAMGIMDMHAYFFNYANNQPFISHERDYDVAEEAAATWAGRKSEDTPTFSDLRSRMLLDTEKHKKRLFIDARYGEQDIYTLPCGLELLDDGGVVLYDGFGGEIRMTGGSITISAPGDIWLKSGRNTNVWSGDDINMRALNSVDIIATNRDVRVKSERNMQLLAGNSGFGGMLLESRAVGSAFDFSKPGEAAKTSGIILRAPTSVVATYSQNIYLRTGSEDGSIANGVIVLDAAKGEQQIITVSQSITSHVKDIVRFNFGEAGEPTHTAFFSKSVSTLPGQLFVGGSLAVDGGVYAKQSFFSSEGHIATANSGSGLVGHLEGESLTSVIDYIAQGADYIETKFPEAAKLSFEAILTNILYVDGGVGSDAVITQSRVSLRTREDYGTAHFAVFEDRWQQLARLGGEIMSVWRERPVKTQTGDTYPYPGAEAFSDGAELFYQQDTVLFDVQNGRSRPHGAGDSLSDLYANPAFAAPVGRSLNTYTVVGGQ